MIKLPLITLTFALAASAFARNDLPELSKSMFKKDYEVSAIKKKDGKRFLKIYTIGAVKTDRDKRATMVKEVLIPIRTKVSIDERGLNSMELKYSNDDLDLGTGDIFNTSNRLVEEIFDTYTGSARGIGVGIAYHANSTSASPSGIQFNDMSSGGIFGGLMWTNGLGYGVRKTNFEVTLSPASDKSTISYHLIEHVKLNRKRGYESEKKTYTVSTEKLMRLPLPVIKKKTYPITGFGM
jgi:hypothetical protein